MILIDKGKQNGSSETIWMSSYSEVWIKDSDACSVHRHATECSKQPAFSFVDNLFLWLLTVALDEKIKSAFKLSVRYHSSNLIQMAYSYGKLFLIHAVRL